ncbi:EHN domain-containing protein [Mycena sanguinolenta]|uniref:EHN domain-containing protein n=1 Tax=Mycena sanguinolenta TaxID=230812 RepID=A0A8H6XM37_9AGAR|nr:EHN domain-containing protein [Mycena sanguinolenta]
MAESPFKISVSEEQLVDLKQKLELTRFPDELDEAGWAYGAPLSDIKRLVSRWTNGYDWRKHEALLNAELPQFTRDIAVDGFGTLNVHYIHMRSTLETAIPLLFVHGWPGTFIEARKIAPLLTQALPDQPTFHLVAVSLPGYGFSEAPKKKGFRLAQYAELCNKLMLALGYEEYVTQGGDWGGGGMPITRKIAAAYGGKHSKAWHSNFPLVAPKFSWNPLHLLSMIWIFLPLLWLSPEQKAGLERSQEIARTGLGYFQEQSTKPQTLGYGLADSPAGLLGWIYEKLVAWTDKYPWDDDEVLTWISLYWFSRAGPAASLRIYYELSAEGSIVPAPYGSHPTIPLGFSYFPGEMVNLPRGWARRTGNVVFEAEHKMGGHFAAHEVPELLVGDLRKMFGKGGPAYGVVSGHSGYAG